MRIPNPTARLFAGLVLGLGLGVLAAASGNPTVAALVNGVEPIGTLWVNAIRMTVIPLVFSMLVSGIGSASSGTIGKIGGRALLLFVAFVASAAGFAGLATPPLLNLLPASDPAVVTQLRGMTDARVSTAELPPFHEWVTGLVPANPIRAAADGAMLPLIVFAVISALALTRTAPEHRELLVRLFAGVREAMFVVIGWILRIAPVGVFFLVLPLAARLGADFAGAVGYFLLVACGLLVIGTLALYPVAALAAGVPLRRFAAACAPAQTVAFSTRSSLASLPAMVEGLERKLELPAAVTGLALPIAGSLFKFGSPIARIVGTLFVARLYGIELGAGETAAIVAALALLSFYSPGIPSGGLFVLAPVYLTFGLPIEGIGLLIALDVIPDMFVTTANVTGGMAVTAILARRSAAFERP